MIQRRALLSATLGGVAAMAVDEGKAWAHSQPMRPRIFVLVHGSWLGGWSWRRVADLLRAQGHTVFAPTMTGVGERRHLLTPDVTLTTWVDDIAGVIEAEELTDVVLVGHSFGGRVVTGVVDRMPERVGHVVFLDSALPVSGRSLIDSMPPEMRQERLARAATSGGLSIPAPTALDLGILDPADQAWVDRRLSPQPLGTNTSAISFQTPIGRGRPVTFVEFTDPVYPASVRAAAFARAQAGWTIEAIPTGHTAMISAPGDVAELLLRIGSLSSES